MPAAPSFALHRTSTALRRPLYPACPSPRSRQTIGKGTAFAVPFSL